jgi:peptidyl-prolyl cis-trans isomerase C
MHMNRIKTGVALAATICLVARSTPAQQSASTNAPAARPANSIEDLFGGTVLAKGKGVEVKRGQVDKAIIGIKAGAAARGQNISAEDMLRLEQQVLDRIIQIQLLLSKATDADKAKGKEMSDKRIETIKTRAGSEEALNRNLKSVGMSPEELQKNLLEEAIAEAVVEHELKIDLTDDQVKKYYDDNPSRFELPEMVRASHILLGTRDPKTGAELTDEQKAAKRKKLEEILKRAREGENFANLAKEFSEDPSSKDKGGEYTFPRGQMVPEFEGAAFSLNTNQISEIITTSYGYHIIKLNERIPAKKEPFNGADTKTILLKQDGQSVTVRDILHEQEMQKQLPIYMAKLKKEAAIEILDERLKPKDIPEAKPPAATP